MVLLRGRLLRHPARPVHHCAGSGLTPSLIPLMSLTLALTLTSNPNPTPTPTPTAPVEVRCGRAARLRGGVI